MIALLFCNFSIRRSIASIANIVYCDRCKDNITYCAARINVYFFPPWIQYMIQYKMGVQSNGKCKAWQLGNTLLFCSLFPAIELFLTPDWFIFLLSRMHILNSQKKDPKSTSWYVYHLKCAFHGFTDFLGSLFFILFYFVGCIIDLIPAVQTLPSS